MAHPPETNQKQKMNKHVVSYHSRKPGSLTVGRVMEIWPVTAHHKAILLIIILSKLKNHVVALVVPVVFPNTSVAFLVVVVAAASAAVFVLNVVSVVDVVGQKY